MLDWLQVRQGIQQAWWMPSGLIPCFAPVRYRRGLLAVANDELFPFVFLPMLVSCITHYESCHNVVTYEI